jgi:hypothetical protein
MDDFIGQELPFFPLIATGHVFVIFRGLHAMHHARNEEIVAEDHGSRTTDPELISCFGAF